MSLRTTLALKTGLLARSILRRRGGGSAVPGAIALRIDPRLLAHLAPSFERGVVFVSGSNGKSTTTNMVAALLREHGLRVFTNASGGNMLYSIVASALPEAGDDGLIDADVAVLEVDEAYGRHVADQLTPTHALLVNVQADHLNRFFDPNRVVGMLREIAERATRLIAVNAVDGGLATLGRELSAEGRAVVRFGISEGVLEAQGGRFRAISALVREAPDQPAADAVVTAWEGARASIELRGASMDIALPAAGLHYALDAAGAIAVVADIAGASFDPERVERAFAHMPTVYGRGEIMHVDGQEIEVIMMKNLASLQANLDTLAEPRDCVLVALDEGSPDPSWLYAMRTDKIERVAVATGTKAAQIATTMHYLGVPVNAVDDDTEHAVRGFLALPKPEHGRKLMIGNYEQNIAIRRILGYDDMKGDAA